MKTLDLADDEALSLLRHVRADLDACKERAAQMALKGEPTSWEERQRRAVHESDCILLEQIKRKLWYLVSSRGIS